MQQGALPHARHAPGGDLLTTHGADKRPEVQHRPADVGYLGGERTQRRHDLNAINAPLSEICPRD
jgi:hypothetical protein